MAFKVGAASKGIIQRDYQHHATVFKSAYAKNPFDNVSADELEEYKRIIEMRNRKEADGDAGVNDVSTLENTTGEHTFNGGGGGGVGGDATDGNATFSEGEGDTSKATDTDLSAMSPKKEKKKKSGL